MSETDSVTLAQWMRDSLDARLADVHVALPATVVSYNSERQSVSVQPAVRRGYKTPEGERAAESLPIVNGVPVSFPGSGEFSVTWPIAVGDTGLLIFCEGSIDKWKSYGDEGDPLDDRRFNLSDAVFVPGIRPFLAPVPAAGVHSTAMVIRSGGAIHAGGTSSLALASALNSVASRLNAVEAAVLSEHPGSGISAGASSYSGTTILKGA